MRRGRMRESRSRGTWVLSLILRQSFVPFCGTAHLRHHKSETRIRWDHLLTECLAMGLFICISCDASFWTGAYMLSLPAGWEEAELPTKQSDMPKI